MTPTQRDTLKYDMLQMKAREELRTHRAPQGIQEKPESWNMTVLQPQSLEKKERQLKSSQAHIQTFWNLLYTGQFLHTISDFLGCICMHRRLQKFTMVTKVPRIAEYIPIHTKGTSFERLKATLQPCSCQNSQLLHPWNTGIWGLCQVAVVSLAIDI